MIDFMLFGGFGNRQTDERMDEQTLVVVESLLRLKNGLLSGFEILEMGRVFLGVVFLKKLSLSVVFAF